MVMAAAGDDKERAADELSMGHGPPWAMPVKEMKKSYAGHCTHKKR